MVSVTEEPQLLGFWSGGGQSGSDGNFYNVAVCCCCEVSAECLGLLISSLLKFVFPFGNHIAFSDYGECDFHFFPCRDTFSGAHQPGDLHLGHAG